MELNLNDGIAGRSWGFQTGASIVHAADKYTDAFRLLDKDLRASCRRLGYDTWWRDRNGKPEMVVECEGTWDCPRVSLLELCQAADAGRLDVFLAEAVAPYMEH